MRCNSSNTIDRKLLNKFLYHTLETLKLKSLNLYVFVQKNVCIVISHLIYLFKCISNILTKKKN